jgi:hypothetical protein
MRNSPTMKEATSELANKAQPLALSQRAQTLASSLSASFKLSTITAVLPLLLSCAGEVDGGENLNKPADGPGLDAGAASVR